MVDLEELEALAKAATPGPWAAIGDPWGDGSVVRTGTGDPHGQRIICFIDPSMEEYEEELFGHRDYAADMAFIAAANPQTVLGLIARIRDLELRIDEALDYAGREAQEAQDMGILEPGILSWLEACLHGLPHEPLKG